MRQIFILLFLIGTLNLSAQQLFNTQSHISPADSIALISYPELQLPDDYKSPGAKSLPDVHDNSQFIYFRPIFSQYGWSCGQASSVGYNFTYEINRVNNTDASLEDNQFPPAFTFNFFNHGEDAVGVNYHYALDAIQAGGNPNVTDYGGMGEDLSIWIDGYEKYYNGMKNRIDNIYSIRVGDSAGLQTLKYWLYDHLEGSPYGGLANFYTDLGGYDYLPTGTPEEGSAVITSFGAYNGHSMTFIGWNDNICWDYNNDGQYTNDIDINNDGKINMKDWEIGGVILANSWGEDWADGGFCYVMYNVLAREKIDGGIWNKQVNVFDAKADYEPTLTFKVTLKHDYRNKIKVIAGVSNNTSSLLPEHTLEFPIFNYSGGAYYMQGNNSAEFYKTLEFGLDVTPLLSYMEPGIPAKIFLQVHENDPANEATGKIVSFSLMDYSDGLTEIPCQNSDVPLIENGTTTLSIVHSPDFDKVTIDTEELPAFIQGETFTYQMEASGGKPDYKWSIQSHYNEIAIEAEDPGIGGTQLISGNSGSGYASQQIEFDFPFYESFSNTVTAHVDGFLMFESMPYPLPYQVDDRLLFENQKMIAALLNREMVVYSGFGDGIWYEGDETFASFRWKTTVEVPGEDYHLDFTATLLPDGTIEIFVNDFDDPENLQRITGISSGDNKNFRYANPTNIIPIESTSAIVFEPISYPISANIDENGLLTADPMVDNKIFNLTINVADDNNISSEKILQLSNGLIYNYNLVAGSNSQIDVGETVSLGFNVKNTGTSVFNDLILNATLADPYITLTDNSEAFGVLNPGEEINVVDALSFEVDNLTPDNYVFSLELSFENDSQTWESYISFRVFAPSITLFSPIVDDGDNNRLDPGETANIIIPLFNSGQTLAEQVIGQVASFDTYLTFNGSTTLNYGDIISGDIVYDTISITMDESTPQGHEVIFNFTVSALPDIQIQQSFELLVGRFPVFIVDLDPGLESGPVMFETLDEMGILYDYDVAFPLNINSYQNLFVCLGRKFSQHVLTDYEASVLQAFLEEGGNVYMEGGLTWYDDPQTAVHPMFSAGTEYINWHDIDSVFGVAGTSLEPMVFGYDGSMTYYNYHLVPEGNAMAVLTEQTNAFNFSVANETESYKTIASTIDFGALIDNEHPSTRKNLMAKMLDFFGTEVVITDMDRKPLATENALNLKCSPNPLKNTTVISFELQEAGIVEFKLFDLNGKVVHQNSNHLFFPEGKSKFELDLSKIPSGVYFGNFKSNNTVDLLKIIIMD